MNDSALKKLLSKYSVNPELQKSIGTNFRSPLEDFIEKAFGERPFMRYGGSVAKYTANSNSSDIDLLCYFRSGFSMPVEMIFSTMYKELMQCGYICEPKNSAICVKGLIGEGQWDYEIDIVPGRFIDNDEKDVNIWQNRTKTQTKTNPVKQIDIVKQSSMKDVIRLIKLYKNAKGFKFKSFYLEMFCVQVIEPLIDENMSLFEKLVMFCSHFKDIGRKKVVDPANSKNDLMKIYGESEYEQIRNSIKELYEVLLTNNETAIINKIENNTWCDTEQLYKADAKSHSPLLNFNVYLQPIQLTCSYASDYSKQILSGNTIQKQKGLYFKARLVDVSPNTHVDLIVSNAGYEARNCKRGERYEMTKIDAYYHCRYESTAYNGDHFVQAVTNIDGRKYYSQPFIVRIRDY